MGMLAPGRSLGAAGATARAAQQREPRQVPPRVSRPPQAPPCTHRFRSGELQSPASLVAAVATPGKPNALVQHRQALTSLSCRGRRSQVLVLRREVAARLGAPDLARGRIIGARSLLRRLKGAQPSVLTHARLREDGGTCCCRLHARSLTSHFSVRGSPRHANHETGHQSDTPRQQLHDCPVLSLPDVTTVGTCTRTSHLRSSCVCESRSDATAPSKTVPSMHKAFWHRFHQRLAFVGQCSDPGSQQPTFPRVAVSRPGMSCPCPCSRHVPRLQACQTAKWLR